MCIIEAGLQAVTVPCLACSRSGLAGQLAQDAPGILNAGMEFDPGELRPTYRLLQGRPGASYALEIARRMGLDEDLLCRAQELIPEAAVNLVHNYLSARAMSAAYQALYEKELRKKRE